MASIYQTAYTNPGNISIRQLVAFFNLGMKPRSIPPESRRRLFRRTPITQTGRTLHPSARVMRNHAVDTNPPS